MNKTLRIALSAACALSLVTTLSSQTPPAPTVKRSANAETKLVGIALYDSGLKLVSTFGSPDDIQPIGIGTSGGGGGGAPGGPGAPSGGRFGGGRPGGGGGGREEMGGSEMSIAPAPPEGLLGDPFGFGATDSRQTAAAPSSSAPGGSMGPGGSGPSGPGAPGMGRPGDPSMGGPGGASGGGSAAEVSNIQLTRWVYKRSGSRYSFVVNRWNQIVQIEAVGLKDGRVKTKRGITFGSTFSQVLNAYKTPDGYDIAGESMLMRFILRDRVAFRLSRVEPNKPHRVTGIVVTAGKP